VVHLTETSRKQASLLNDSTSKTKATNPESQQSPNNGSNKAENSGGYNLKNSNETKQFLKPRFSAYSGLDENADQNKEGRKLWRSASNERNSPKMSKNLEVNGGFLRMEIFVGTYMRRWFSPCQCISR
jgi:hypothetical protein